MGWNSWDNYGASVTEAEVLANAAYMRDHLLPHGWDTVVVDIQWYEPGAVSGIYRPFADVSMDAHGRLTPAENRFPSASNGAGFRALADTLHSWGLKFGIHIMRGVPRQAVHANSPILNSVETARGIAHTADICEWNTDMYGVDPSAAGSLAYYESTIALYVSWGVDFLKVDDILYPYHEGEIDLIAQAIARCGRPMVLSLSCGPTDTKHAEHLRSRADMWRMTGDFWDDWGDLSAAFDFCATWAPFAGDGHWPDADMLPVGFIGARSGERALTARESRFSAAEQRLLITLWCVVRSPLMLGADLTKLNDATLKLITNQRVLALGSAGSGAREAYREKYLSGDVIVWSSLDGEGKLVVSVFNLGPVTREVRVDLTRLPEFEGERARSLWNGTERAIAGPGFLVPVEAHGVEIYVLE